MGRIKTRDLRGKKEELLKLLEEQKTELASLQVYYFLGRILNKIFWWRCGYSREIDCLLRRAYNEPLLYHYVEDTRLPISIMLTAMVSLYRVRYLKSVLSDLCLNKM